MSKTSGDPALFNELVSYYIRYINPSIKGDFRFLEKRRTGFTIKRFFGEVISYDFEPRLVDAVELALSRRYRNESTRGSHTTCNYARHDDGDIVNTLALFDFGCTLEEWKARMDADPYADDYIEMSIHRFNRSKGQFYRYRYAAFPQDYIFKTTTDDRLAMYIGYYRMFPVKEAKGEVARILADKPMCLQLEVLMEGY